ncbi:macrophage mannose receptor 1-like isoform X3 [Myxocyprinus asiaticus]|uniref:macrophage mannose receptor 1-like isoform X2 n=1 Tax=Myxocyprinus asiaticus TaxID=70543 RepID=UPI002222B7E3|nr:macrophage mannose receptor 1-like isoform X2 [Myxocyprinus asiaticus]XP_051555737.1 macrophage mannose receptor 1-like isoform X3 [Myxocyprinus asiaticus]
MNVCMCIYLSKFILTGFLWSSSGLSRQYHYINERMSWNDAQSYCRSRFTDLATVDSMNDVSRLVKTVDAGYSGSVWIGLKRGTQSRWGWSDGDNATQNSSWNPGKPDGEGECVYSANGFWFNHPCSKRLYFVCYNESTGYNMTEAWKNWTEAQSYCRQYYTDLATIRSSEEQNQLYSIVGDGPWVWIGLFLDSWEWSDQWSLFFRYWAAGQPSQSSGSGDCVGMLTTDSGRWVPDNCDLQRPFICHGGPKPLSRQYYYVNERMSWPEAQSYCRARYTDLATVDTMNDVSRLVNRVNPGHRGSVWIGLKRNTKEHWAWSMGDSTLSEYTNWAKVFTNDEGTCGTTVSAWWWVHPCTSTLPLLCYKRGGGYTAIETAMTWRDAQSYCRQHYTDLASIRSSEENQLVGDTPSYWIGLFLDFWQWSDQWSLTFRHWTAGQPSQTSGSGDCVAMVTSDSGKWAHYSCDQQQPFMCHGWPKPLSRPYEYINKSMTWNQAQAYCRARYTDLATVDTTDDVSRLVNIVEPGYNGSVWIGLNRRTQIRWAWSMGNSTLSQYTKWKPGEPTGDQECVRSSNGSWYDENCTTSLPFVCYNDGTGYIIIKMAMTWRDAQSYCRQHYTDLASISSPEEQQLISKESSVWIGLFLDSWQWSDQWSLNFRYWTAGQPSQSSGSGDCVGMLTTDSGKWAQYSCDQQNPFICYGDDRFIKKQTVRLKLSSDEKCNLNDPSTQTAILNKISEKLKSMGLGSKSKISWRKQEGEDVFCKETKRKENSDINCDDTNF